MVMEVERRAYWYKQVSKDLNIEIDKEVFDKMFEICESIDYGWGYLIHVATPTLFEGRVLYVISWYILPEERNFAHIKQIQNDIKRLAKENKCKYIKQYSHFNEQFNQLLVKEGYKISEYTKEV